MRKFGWVPDRPDQRDLIYAPTIPALPSAVDLRSLCPPVYDQGELGSCTANAIAAHLDFNRHKQGEAEITPSRLFIYYNERVDQGTVRSDSGASIRESVKTIVKKGACPEASWPYLIAKFKRRPPAGCYTAAATYEATQYLRLNRLVSSFQACLAEGYPFVIGFTVYESFHQADSSGRVPLPAPGETVLGGHAVLVVGYEPDGSWICRNSWGPDWGDHGYFYLPQSYLTNHGLSSDFWSIRAVK